MNHFFRSFKNSFAGGVIAAAIVIFCASNSYGQFNPIKIIRDSLPNGLQVVYNIDRTAPVVSTVIHYKVGSRYETIGKTGYAHFFEHLMFESTRDIPRATMDKCVQEAGGELNAHTSWDETVFYFKLPSNQLKLALWIESQRMRGLNVDTIGVETQRGVVREELKMRTTNQPYGSLIQKICENLFPNTTYGWAVIGLDEDLAKATIDDFRNFYNTYYQPGNAVLVISGDINLDSTKQFVRDYFGEIPAGNKVYPKPINLQPLAKGYSEQIEDPKAQLPAVFIGLRGVSLNEDDYYAVSLLTNILASGQSSKLYQKLVDKDQIAAQVSVFPLSLEQAGAIVLVGISNPGKKIKDVEEGMLEEIERVVKQGISDEELKKAKNIVESEFVSDKKNVQSKAESIARYFAYYNNPNMINTEIEKYNKVTKEDIIRVGKKYFVTDKRVVLTYVPKGYSE